MHINFHILTDMLHIRSLNLKMAEVIEKWEEKGLETHEQECFEKYDMYFKLLYFDPINRFDEKNRGKTDVPPVPFYWFELLQIHTLEWKLAVMEPADAANGRQHEILPPDVMPRITEFNVDPGHVYREKIRSGLVGKTFELEFVHFSDTHIFGTVKAHKTERMKPIKWQEDMGTAFQVFFEYRDRFTKEVLKFAREFAGGIPADAASDEPGPAAEGEPGEGPELEVAPPRYGEQPEPEAGEKGVNLNRLTAISRLPGSRDLLMTELGKLITGDLAKDVGEYQARKEHYKKAMLRRIKTYGSAGGDSPGPSWFALTRFVPGSSAPEYWAMTSIRPNPQAFEPAGEILPPSLFHHLIDTPVDPDRVMGDTLVAEKHLHKTVDVLWIRYSPNCIMGVVRENIDCWKAVSAGKVERIGDHSRGKLFADYHLLFHRMRSHPEVAESFIDAFTTQLLPKLKESPPGGP